MIEIKEGSVVRLKSGGPKMTVSTMDSHNGYAWCKWFIHDELRTEKLALCSLEVVSD